MHLCTSHAHTCITHTHVHLHTQPKVPDLCTQLTLTHLPLGYTISCEIPSPGHHQGSQKDGISEGMAPVPAALSLGPARSFQPSPPALHGDTQ